MQWTKEKSPGGTLANATELNAPRDIFLELEFIK